MERFFILGNPRSGTTLFRLMLNKHSNMVVPPEAGFLVWLSHDYANHHFDNNYSDFLKALKNTTKIDSWNLDYNDLELFLENLNPDNYTKVIDVIYKYYVQKVLNKNKNIIGDKNNYYIRHVDDIVGLYPNAKFIHIIRDGRSVAASYQGLMKKKMKSKYAPNLPSKIEDIAYEWMDNILAVEKSFKYLDDKQTLTVRFEDLVNKPEMILMKVCNFLNVEYEDKMLKYYDTSYDEGLEPKEFLEWKSKNLNPIDKAEANKFELLSDSDRVKFDSICEELLVKYNYI